MSHIGSDRLRIMAAIRNPPTPAPAKKGLFYGWIIVIASVAATMVVGESMFCFSLFLKPLESEFLLNRATISSAFSLYLLGYAASCILTGRISERYSARKILLASSVLAGSGMLLTSTAADINQLRAFMLLTGLGSGGLWALPTSIVIQWFKGRRNAGLALAIVTTGACLSMLIFPPIINALILNHSWRYAYLVLGIAFFVMTATGALFMKRPPQSQKMQEENAGVRQTEIPATRIIFSPTFLGLGFANIVGVQVLQAISAHLAAYATDTGISATGAALALSMVGALSVPARIMSGAVADRIGWRRVLAGAMLGMSVSLVILFLGKGTIALYSFVLLYGIANGCRTPAVAGILGEFFRERLGLLIGVTYATGQFVGMFAPYLTGYIYDQTGSYSLAFGILAALVLAGALVIISLRREAADEAELAKPA